MNTLGPNHKHLTDSQVSTLLLLAQELDFLYEECSSPESAAWQARILEAVSTGGPMNFSSVKNKLTVMILNCWTVLDSFNMTVNYRLFYSTTWQIRNHKVRASSLDRAFARMEDLLPTIGAEDFRITCRKEQR